MASQHAVGAKCFGSRSSPLSSAKVKRAAGVLISSWALCSRTCIAGKPVLTTLALSVVPDTAMHEAGSTLAGAPLDISSRLGLSGAAKDLQAPRFGDCDPEKKVLAGSSSAVLHIQGTKSLEDCAVTVSRLQNCSAQFAFAKQPSFHGHDCVCAKSGYHLRSMRERTLDLRLRGKGIWQFCRILSVGEPSTALSTDPKTQITCQAPIVCICSQQDVDNFGSLNCTRAIAKVHIGRLRNTEKQSLPIICCPGHANNIRSLHAWQSISEIRILGIVANPRLANLSGLRVKEVGRLDIKDNYDLTSLNGLQELRRVHLLTIAGNPQLSQLDGMRADVKIDRTYENDFWARKGIRKKGRVIAWGLTMNGNNLSQVCAPGTRGPIGLPPCVPCSAGRFNSKYRGWYCLPCGDGNWSQEGMPSCTPCPFLTESSSDHSTCVSWFFSRHALPFYLMCFSAFVALVSVMFCCIVVRLWVRPHQLQEREKRQHSLLEKISKAVSEGNHGQISNLAAEFQASRYGTAADFSECVRLEEKYQSETGGVGVAYMVSAEFLELAQVRTGMTDPSFYDLKDSFFLGKDGLGKDALCPRDGRPGCALIDSLPRNVRGCCTHFLSWTWGYTVLMMQQSLRRWIVVSCRDPCSTFLYCCFFCNNQYRIMVEGKANGSDDLENIFESRLARIGQVIAIVDTWDSPKYLQRIWTIYEQFTAAKLGINVQMVLPLDAHSSLMEKIGEGSAGILAVTSALLDIDSENAEAYSVDDKMKVQGMITSTIGFKKVNEAVAMSMSRCIGLAVQEHFASIVSSADVFRDGGRSSREVATNICSGLVDTGEIEMHAFISNSFSANE